jgi:hypothetical protein
MTSADPLVLDLLNPQAFGAAGIGTGPGACQVPAPRKNLNRFLNSAAFARFDSGPAPPNA